MSIVVLDSGPLGMVTNPKATPENLECQQWLESVLMVGMRAIIPEVADYEVRRSLLLHDKQEGLNRLNQLQHAPAVEYLPISTPVMLKAAQLWAETRRLHRRTAEDKALDIDVILAAQAQLLGDGDEPVVVATTNITHLEWFVDARHWRQI